MILNRQRGVKVSLRALELFLARAQKRVKITPGTVGICLVTNGVIAAWNWKYRRKRGPTDVLSFRSEHDGHNPRDSYLGDIAIAPAIARRNARKLGRTLDSEMRILILHGLLHLMGYDHETDQGQMERRERRLRRDLRVA